MIGAEAINHIGIAVKSIKACRSFYEDVLGARYEGEETVTDQKVRVAFFLIGPGGHEVRLELLEPTSEDSPIARHINKRGEGLHHIAYTVRDINKRLEELRKAGVQLIDDTPRPGAHHSLIAFLHPRSSAGVLTEICQPER
ncbi:MAG TPA: methylmalonyl-CoA epimerase [Phycisphaeraceae bacterium]|nr:methylmalonyl-CoA epimerase [Phycisphaeraceae bacterium]